MPRVLFLPLSLFRLLGIVLTCRPGTVTRGQISPQQKNWLNRHLDYSSQQHVPSLTVHVTEGSNNEKKKNPQKNRQNLLPPPNLQTAFTNLQPERSPTLRQEKTLRNVEFEEKYHQTTPAAETRPLDFGGDITLHVMCCYSWSCDTRKRGLGV